MNMVSVLKAISQMSRVRRLPLFPAMGGGEEAGSIRPDGPIGHECRSTGLYFLSNR